MLYKDLRKLPNGAGFHNVDLHIHSYGASHDVKDPGMTPEAIVDSAVQQELRVIAITDHNSDTNVEKAVAHAQQNHPGEILVLAGVEVTTAHGHLLVYFPPERTADLAKFLSRIDLIGKMGHDSTRTAKSMADTIAEAEKLGGICVAAHIDREKTGFEKFAPGFQNWKRDILLSPGLYGLECEANDALGWYSDVDEPGSAGAERRQILAARRLKVAGRQHLAHIQGSDSHSMRHFEHNRPNKTWTRMKLDELTFNAFRVAMTDPTARVRACASVPASFPRLRGVVFTGGFLHQETIHFSDNLTCFIGGRGTGKSTAIAAVAYGLGLNDGFRECDNCPDTVILFCEDGNGIIYKYTRTRSGDIEVLAKEDDSITDVPVDSFRIEYFGQGELSRVAEDPLKYPQLFQDFLDRHTNLRDLVETQQSLLLALRENAGRVIPLESAFMHLPQKKKTLEEIEKKLKIAEEGNLREVVGKQSKLASEKAVREAVEKIAADFRQGYTLNNLLVSFDQILKTAGTCTDDSISMALMAGIKKAIEANNAALKTKEKELNAMLKGCATELTKQAGHLKNCHTRLSAEVATTLADLRSRGIVTDIPGLELLLKQKTSTAREVAAVEQKADELKQAREQRAKLRKELKGVREEMTERRKSQLKAINDNLAITIKDYLVFVKYDDSGITKEYEQFLQGKMHGTYLHDDAIAGICRRTNPADLADWVLSQDHQSIAKQANISSEWAETLVNKLRYWDILFELQALAKPPKPVITVRTRSSPPKDIPVSQLSDGQRHTILLTIAMLAQSNDPLIIDQPEDDLDNAFIFSSVVTTLRAIKEKRQVIIVTHNANIAVLGDAEFLLPMYRENDCGKAKDRGSIDSTATLIHVQNILEGGAEAFLRRKAIYGH